MNACRYSPDELLALACCWSVFTVWLVWLVRWDRSDRDSQQ